MVVEIYKNNKHQSKKAWNGRENSRIKLPPLECSFKISINKDIFAYINYAKMVIYLFLNSKKQAIFKTLNNICNSK